MTLKFSPANAKTASLYQVPSIAAYLRDKRKVYSLDLSSGLSCPGALLCKSMAVPRDDDPTRFTVKDGPKCQFRCFSASQEVQYPYLRKLRAHNFDCLRQTRGARQCAELIESSLPHNVGVVRFHVGGDFFKRAYLLGALEVASRRTDVLFYAYTKSLDHLIGVDMLDPSNGLLRENFLLTASRGGRHDELIDVFQLREARVVLSEGEAGSLPIDHDDSHAASPGGSFALLIHGTQPAGSDAGKALAQLKGKGSYARK